MAYGSGVPRHGRARACLPYQLSKGGVSLFFSGVFIPVLLKARVSVLFTVKEKAKNGSRQDDQGWIYFGECQQHKRPSSKEQFIPSQD